MKPASKRTVKPSSGVRIVQSLEEAIAWAEGRSTAARVTKVRVPNVNVRTVRCRLGLSQSQFAARFGFSAASVRNWEQGRTQPEGPARILLAVIARHPEAVEDVLHA